MLNVKTTLLSDSKNRNVYFDAEEGIRTFEQESGKKISENVANLIRGYAPIINKAYEDGYRDGMKEVSN